MNYVVCISAVLLPSLAAAWGGETLAQFDDYSGMLASVSLWSTTIIAFSTTAMVWVLSRKMHGGVFGSVLAYFSLGMSCIFLGFVVNIPLVQKISSLYVGITYNALYIIGYILMGIAANKLLKVIKGE